MKYTLVLTMLLITGVSFACDNARICVDDRIIDTENDTGRIVAIFSNGKVKVDWDKSTYGTTVTTLRRIFKSVTCVDHLCIDDNVIDNENDTGRVIEAFTNGKTKIDWDKSSYGVTIKSSSNLWTSTSCTLELCLGDRIIDNENDTGKVIALYSNGKAKIDWDKSSYGVTISNIRQLSKSYRCSGNLCVGQYIIDDEDDTGKVVEIFENGKVRVKWDKSSYGITVTTMRRLGYRLDNCYN